MSNNRILTSLLLRTLRLATASSLVAVLLVARAKAGPIIQPVGVSTTANEFHPISQTIDQSGLNTSYVSGVTDFSTYVASNGNGNNAVNQWLSDLTFPKVVSFDLGASLPIGGFALWSIFPGTGTRDFELFSDTDGDFGNGGTSSLGSFTAVDFFSPGQENGQAFYFGTTTTQFVHLRIDNNHGGVDLSVGEFAFEQVPEPSSLVLLATSGLLLLLPCARHRFRRK